MNKRRDLLTETHNFAPNFQTFSGGHWLLSGSFSREILDSTIYILVLGRIIDWFTLPMTIYYCSSGLKDLIYDLIKSIFHSTQPIENSIHADTTSKSVILWRPLFVCYLQKSEELSCVSCMTVELSFKSPCYPGEKKLIGKIRQKIICFVLNETEK